MDAEPLLELKRSQPFTPFRLRTREGKEHQVNAAEDFLVTCGKIAFVDGPGISQIGLTHMQAIELLGQR